MGRTPRHFFSRFPEWWVFGIFLLSALVVFKSVFLSGSAPFPGNFMQAWFEPWRSLNFVDGKITLAHKPVVEDAFRHILPFRLLGVDMLKAFHIPLWNPYNGSGQPLLATLNSGFFDPFNILYAVLSPGIAQTAYVLIQYILIAIGMYVYIRTLKLSPVTGVFTAFVYVLSGFVTIRLIFTNYGLMLAIVPASLAIIEHSIRSGKLRMLFVLPVFIALMIVSTQPQVTIYALSILGTYGALRLWTMYRYGMRKVQLIGMFVLLCVIGVALTAVQLFPTYELMNYAHIRPGNSFDVVEKFMVPFWYLLSIPIPNFFGNSSTYNFWVAKSDSIQTASYLGMLPVVLALFALLRRRKENIVLHWYFGILAVVSVALAVSWSGSHWFYHLPIPIISTGAPARFFMVTTLALSVLAAFGFEQIYKAKKPSGLLTVLSIISIVAVGYVVYRTHTLLSLGEKCPPFTPGSCWQTGFRNSALALGIFIPQAVLFFLLSFSHIFAHKLKHMVAGVIVISVLAFGSYNAWKALPQSPSMDVFPELPVVRAMQSYTKDARVFGLGDAMLYADLATQFRIYDPQYYHPLYIYRYRELLEYATNGRYIETYPRGDAAIRDYLRDNPDIIWRRDRLLALDSVPYRLFKKEELGVDAPQGETVWQDDTWRLTASTSALPRAYIAPNVRVESTPAGILAALYDPDFDYRHTVILESDVPLSHDAEPVESDVRVTRYDAHEVVIDADVSRAAMLVLTDNYYPGWNAYVDGQQVPLYRANYTFRAVALPAGEHVVVFRYKPDSVRHGIVVTALAFLALLALYRKRDVLLG